MAKILVVATIVEGDWMKEGKVTRKRIGRAINMLEHDGKLKSDEDDYALLAEIILLIASRKYMSTNRAVEIAQDIETIVPYVSELKIL